MTTLTQEAIINGAYGGVVGAGKFFFTLLTLLRERGERKDRVSGRAPNYDLTTTAASKELELMYWDELMSNIPDESKNAAHNIASTMGFVPGQYAAKDKADIHYASRLVAGGLTALLLTIGARELYIEDLQNTLLSGSQGLLQTIPLITQVASLGYEGMRKGYHKFISSMK